MEIRELNNSVKTEQLSQGFVSRGDVVYFKYDDLADVLFVMFASPHTETVVHHIDAHIGLMYDPDTLEVLGFQVENFAYSFIKKHRSLCELWTNKSDVKVDPARVIQSNEAKAWKVIGAVESAIRPSIQKVGLGLKVPSTSRFSIATY